MIAPSPSGFTSPTKTRAPSSTNAFAVPRPMPDAPPVTTATFPSSRPMAPSLLQAARAALLLELAHRRGRYLVHPREHLLAAHRAQHLAVGIAHRRLAGLHAPATC